MTIAFNMSGFSAQPGLHAFAEACLLWGVQQHPEISFIWISRTPVAHPHSFGNLSYQSLPMSSANRLLWKYWQDITLPAYLKKARADMLVQAEGLLSGRTDIPQWVMAPTPSETVPQNGFKPGYCRSFQNQLLKQYGTLAQGVFCLSTIAAKEITQYMGQPNVPVIPLLPVATPVEPATESMKIATRDRLTEGWDYFLYYGPLHHQSELVNLLKGFSLFKKWQRSSLKLVLLASEPTQDTAFLSSLQSYKYRSDVVVLEEPGPALFQEVVSAAYAAFLPYSYIPNYEPVLQMMQAGIPLVTAASPAISDLFDDAVAMVRPNLPEDLSEKMIRLYKNETDRSELLQKGMERSANFTVEKQARQFWDVLLNASQAKA